MINFMLQDNCQHAMRFQFERSTLAVHALYDLLALLYLTRVRRVRAG